MADSRRDLSDEAFRAQLREWLTRVYPAQWRDPALRLRGADARRWQRMQYEAGWRAPGWPAEHGGLGLSIRKQVIYQQELERCAVARTLDHGVRMVGPILIRYGTPAQRAAYLLPILSGEHQWCQGYSEPGAGSDLASLQMRAERQGECYLIQGQKIWTTLAADASHIFLLARTASGGRRQHGITFFVAPMATPGISVQPIKNLAGEEEFYAVQFDGVRVPVGNVIGAEHDGWRIAKTLLGFERLSQGSPALARHAMHLARRIAHHLHLEHGRYADRLAHLACDLHDTSVLYEDICEAAAAGREQPEDSSMAKLLAAELLQRITECTLELVGEAPWRGPAALAPELRTAAERLFLLARPVTIFGGTSEVQRNILGKVLLGS